MSRASIKSLEKQIFSGKMNSDKAYIFSHIIKNDCSIEDLRQTFTMQYSTITARLSDLLDLGVIYIRKLDNNGRFSVYSYEADEAKQLVNAKKREDLRFDKTVRKLLSFNRVFNIKREKI